LNGLTTMNFVTDFADLGLLLPLVALVALSLAAVGRKAQAAVWLLTVTGTFGMMLVLKVLAFVILGSDEAPACLLCLSNPSGHTAAGSVVYGGLLVLLGERLASRRSLALLAGAGFGFIFGISRVTLGMHSVADVLVGGAVGLIGALALAWLAGRRRPEAPATGLALVAAVAVFGVLAFHGNRLGAEEALRAIAAELRPG
jgi:membrane-associated phospholipid phosphatase